MDGAIIADDFYLERHQREKNFMFHSVRDGSYADRVGFNKREIIISVNGIKPENIKHLKRLLEGDKEKQIITRHWSSIDNQFYDFFVTQYKPGLWTSTNEIYQMKELTVMNDIICPHCEKAFKVDETGYAAILNKFVVGI